MDFIEKLKVTGLITTTIAIILGGAAVLIMMAKMMA